MIITTLTSKGGVGKTTAIIAMATLINDKIKGSNPLVLDCDPNGSAMLWDRNGALPFTVTDNKDVLSAVLAGGDRLEQIRALHKVILIDSSARPSDKDINRLSAASDLVVIPTTADVLSVSAMNAMADKIGTSQYRVLVNMAQPNSNPKNVSDGDQAVAVISNGGHAVFSRPIRRYTAYPRAINAGLTIKACKGSSNAWVDWLVLWDELDPLVKVDLN
jgi:chromosome partitioning protein